MGFEFPGLALEAKIHIFRKCWGLPLHPCMLWGAKNCVTSIFVMHMIVYTQQNLAAVAEGGTAALAMTVRSQSDLHNRYHVYN
jgi:hypothetical protein